MPLSRAVSMEQRLQDIAHLFNPIPGMGVGMGVGDVSSYPHYPSHYSYQVKQKFYFFGFKFINKN